MLLLFQRSIQGFNQSAFENSEQTTIAHEAKTAYVVIESFKNTAGDGIDLVAGENVTVLEQTDTGWWLVAGVHGEGWAPAAYIQAEHAMTSPAEPARRAE